MEKVTLADELSRIERHGRPHGAAADDGDDVTVAKAADSAPRHRHPDPEDLFLCRSGRVTIGLSDGPIDLRARGLLVVPEEADHCRRAEAEAQLPPMQPACASDAGDRATAAKPGL